MADEQIVERRSSTVRTRVLRVGSGERGVVDDRLSVEEPLEVVVRNGTGVLPLGVLFRTPGNDEPLVLGMLFHEGIIRKQSDVVSFRFTEESDATMPASRVTVKLAADVKLVMDSHRRAYPISSACGACGKSALEALRISRSERFRDKVGPSISEEMIRSLPLKLNEHQSDFQHTGGLHAAARFDGSGKLIAASEDIGRHNAMDKLVGNWIAKEDLAWEEQVILFSGRVGFDLMQKALVAGCPFLVSIGAPSSFAVELATMYNITLVGFLRGNRFNVYSAPVRIRFSD